LIQLIRTTNGYVPTRNQLRARWSQGVKSEGGSARLATTTSLVKGLGSKIDSFNFAVSGTDAYVTVEMPGDVSVAAATMAVSVGGGATARTVVLLIAARLGAAAEKQTTYRPARS
jgi:uncharacterized protein with GYD domain